MKARCRSGSTDRLDTAFSRDPGGVYLQERLRAAGPELVDWMEHRAAQFYVCGRASTLGTSVGAALTAILLEQGAESSGGAAAARISRWMREGRCRADLFG